MNRNLLYAQYVIADNNQWDCPGTSETQEGWESRYARLADHAPDCLADEDDNEDCICMFDKVKDFIKQELAQREKEVLEHFQKVQSQAWDDAEHCTCLPYAIALWLDPTESGSSVCLKCGEVLLKTVVHHCKKLEETPK